MDFRSFSRIFVEADALNRLGFRFLVLGFLEKLSTSVDFQPGRCCSKMSATVFPF